MIKILYNKKNICLLHKKLENKSFIINYSKFFIRYTNNINDCVIDNFIDISFITQKSGNIGGSSILNLTFYRHKLYKTLKFLWFKHGSTPKYNILNYIPENCVKNYIIFMKPIKGGVESYSSGFKGVFQKNQIRLIFIDIKYYNVNISVKNFLADNSKNKFLVLRIPAKIGKIKIQHIPINNNFNNTKTIKYGTNNTITYFRYFSELIPNENKKTIKKYRKYYFKKKNK